MANATLSFTLPDEQDEFERACKAGDLYSVIADFDHELRNHLRYNSRPTLHSPTVEEIRQLLWEMVSERNVNFS
jgi:hypothetical protein